MEKLFAFLLSIGTLTAVLGKCTMDEAISYFQRSLHDFGSELVSRISKATNNHFVASSLSLWTLLVSVDRLTLEELEDVLNLRPQPCYSEMFLEFMEAVGADKQDVIFERYASIYGDKKLFRNSFKQYVEATSVAKLKKISFDSLDKVTATINKDVKWATRGSIDTILTSTNLKGAKAALLQTLYFKAKWKFQILTQYTLPSPFYSSGGERVGNANFIYTKLKTNLADIPEIEARVLELPYENNRFSMLIIVPYMQVTIQKVFESLKKFNLNLIFARFARETVRMRIPRFQIISYSNLKDILADMGFKSIFGATSLPDMDEVSYYVSNVVQKAIIEVTEDGSGTSVASSVTLQIGDAYIAMSHQEVASTAFFVESEIEEIFVANRPFVFMIVEKYTNIALFIGSYSKPSLY